MRIVITQMTIGDGIRIDRTIAEWELPNTKESLQMSFTQMATPDTTKVATFIIQIRQD